MNVFGFLLPAWVKPAICAVALTATFSAGWKIESLRWHAHEAKALKQQQAAFNQQLARQNKVSTDYERTREQNHVDTGKREQAIRTIYKDRVVPAECAAPDAVRVQLEQAVNSANHSGESG